MSLGIHLGGEVTPLLVYHVSVLGEQGHGFHGESQHGLGALLVEPLHEPFLQPVETVPVRLAAVGEEELTEEALEVGLVIVGDVPEHGLVVTGSRGLVDGIDNLLKAIGDHLVYGALPER